MERDRGRILEYERRVKILLSGRECRLILSLEKGSRVNLVQLCMCTQKYNKFLRNVSVKLVCSNSDVSTVKVR